ncbi:hypothetical protein JCM30237_16410 [Halolamina litorea]|uniref:Small CPxCG-related zinc finger protein n=1 Tax=Halolamina litorea TaxID=1515593 RepID=A0ABD6BVM0_9EURY|nr:hypothetical protein [Halolamina litorea]
MSTQSCGRCGSPAPEALLRNVSLNVDGSEVDSQTICPDCFSDWIAHYQEEMAGDMPGADDARSGAAADAGSSDRLSETVSAAVEHDGDAAAGEERLQDAVDDGATKASPPGRTGSDEIESVGGGSGGTGNNEIREVGGAGGGPADDDVEIDLDDGGDSVDVDLGNGDDAEEDEDDDGGLLLG